MMNWDNNEIFTYSSHLWGIPYILLDITHRLWMKCSLWIGLNHPSIPPSPKIEYHTWYYENKINLIVYFNKISHYSFLFGCTDEVLSFILILILWRYIYDAMYVCMYVYSYLWYYIPCYVLRDCVWRLSMATSDGYFSKTISRL